MVQTPMRASVALPGGAFLRKRGDRGIGGIADFRRVAGQKRRGKHLGDLAYRQDREPFADGFVDLIDIRFVALGDQHGMDPRRGGGARLLPQSADRQYLAAQGDLARHGKVGAAGTAGKLAHERRDQRDTGTRPVLRDRALWHVDMDIAVLIKLRI